MTKVLPIIALLATSLILAGCAQQPSAGSISEPASESTQKVGDTTKSGTVMVAGDKVFLKEASGTQLEIDSYSVDLEALDSQQVTVTGQYSGETLFVGEVE